MRRVLKQAYCAPCGSQSSTFLKVKDLSNRQALLHRPLCLARVARHAESEFARGKPINWLAVIAGKGYVHFTVKSPHEFRAKLGVVIEEEHGCVLPPKPGINGYNSSLPFGIQQVPITFEFLRAHQLVVVSNFNAAAAADEREDVFAFGINVLVLPLQPLGLIPDFRQDQKRFDRSEGFGGVKSREGRAFAADKEIDQILLRSPFGDNSRAPLGAATGN